MTMMSVMRMRLSRVELHTRDLFLKQLIFGSFGKTVNLPLFKKKTLTNWIVAFSAQKHPKVKSGDVRLNLLFFFTLSVSQEVILKRAADLVEALYGLPHNNQVSGRTHTPAGILKSKKKSKL